MDIQRNPTFTIPTYANTNQEFTSSKKAHQAIAGDVPDQKIVSHDPPLMFTSEEIPKPPSIKEHFDDFMFD